MKSVLMISYGGSTKIVKFMTYNVVGPGCGLIGDKVKMLNSFSKQVRPNDVWTCVACSYFIYKKLT